MILFQMNNSASPKLHLDAYADLAARLEVEASEQPLRYHAKVMALAALGPLLLLMLLLVLFAGLFWLAQLAGIAEYPGGLVWQWLLPLGLSLYLAHLLLWVESSPVTGIALTEQDVPELFRLIRKLRRKLKIRSAVHQVLLTDQFQAKLVCQPIYGPFGPQRYALQIGLPLLQGLSTKQLAAVLAHELGHMAHGHRISANWIFFLRQAWEQVHHSLQKNGYPWAKQWLAVFVARYEPYFSAYTRALARQQEFLADQAAVRVAGKEDAADALVALQLKARFLQQCFWPRLMQQATEQPTPNATPYSQMRLALSLGFAEAPGEQWLEQALAKNHHSNESHASLRERLEQLGCFPRLPKPFRLSAAQVLLGPQLQRLSQQLDQAWLRQIRPEWQQRHQQIRDTRQQLQQLEQQLQTGRISLDDAFRRARLTEELGDGAAACEQYRQIVAQHPEHAPSCFAAGRLLLAAGNPAGLEMLENAMRYDNKAIIPCCRLAYDFLQQQHRSVEAESYYQIACERAALEDQALAERISVNVGDTLITHDLRPAQLAHLQAQLSRYPDIRRAWLTRKQVQHFADRSLYVLLIERKRWPLRSSADDKRFARQLVDTLEMPGQSFVQVLDKSSLELKKRARQLGNAAIYPAGNHKSA